MCLLGCGRLHYERLTCPPDTDCDILDGGQARPRRDGGRPNGPRADGGAIDGSQDDASTDSGEDGGEAPTTPQCGSFAVLHETFDGETNNYWNPRRGGSGVVAFENGRVELRLGEGNALASTSPDPSFTLRGSEVAVEVPRADAPYAALELREGPGVDRVYEPFSPTDRGVAIGVEDGMLKAMALDRGVPRTLVMRRYQPASDRHWRIREADGRVYWETSANRRTWSTLHETTAEMDTETVWLALVARGTDASGSAAHFDDLGDASSDAARCPASTLSVDLDDGVIRAPWLAWNGGGSCTMSEQAGEIRLQFPDEEYGSYCSVRTNAQFDLRDDAFTFELIDAPNSVNLYTTAQLVDRAPGTILTVQIYMDTATVRVTPGYDGETQFEQSFPVAPGTARYWRIREEAGRLYWETSPNGARWTTRADTETTVEVDSLSVSLSGSLSRQSGRGPQVVRYGSVNEH